MTQPQPGQPFAASPGLRLSTGDPDATPGTDAYKGVIILEAGAPVPNIVDAAVDFDIKVFFKTLMGFAVYELDEDNFEVSIHVRDLAGDAVLGSPFSPAGAPPYLVEEEPDGASLPVAPDQVKWYSSTVTIPGGTLAADTTYRITVDGDDAATHVFAFHDGTVIHTEAV
jgi:hypothetical protein